MHAVNGASSSHRVRVGVAGVGVLGYHHARLLCQLPVAQVVGVYDRRANRAAEVAAELGVVAFPSLEALIEAVDALIVAVPSTAHRAVAEPALAAGRHVLVEKPLAAHPDDARALVDMARAQGVVLATGHVERYNPVLRACTPWLDRPRFIESHRLAPFTPRGIDVDVVLDLMIHDIDLVLHLVGSPVARVDAVGVPVLTSQIDIANARVTFANGAVANITASRVSRERLRKLRLFQPSGYLSLDLARGCGEFLRLRDAAGHRPADPADWLERHEIRSDGVEPLRGELEAFLQAVLGDPSAPVVPGEAGLRAVEVAWEIASAIDRARPLLEGR